MIPEVDNLGNPLIDVAGLAHQLIHRQGISDGSFTTPGQMGRWQEDDPEPHSTLTVIMEDTPEHDSMFKQIGIHVAEVTNQWGLFVYKEGKNGVQSWVLDNPNYREGEPADPSVIAPSQT